MFAYYLKSLHNYRERNMDMGNATSQACLDLMSSYIEGHYLFSKAMLHQGVRTIDSRHPDLKSFWSVEFDDETNQSQMLKWFDAHVEKNTNFNQQLLNAINHQAEGLNNMMIELLARLKYDLPKDCAGNIDAIKMALSTVNESESSMVSATQAALVPTKQVMKSTRKVITKVPARKSASKGKSV